MNELVVSYFGSVWQILWLESYFLTGIITPNIAISEYVYGLAHLIFYATITFDFENIDLAIVVDYIVISDSYSDEYLPQFLCASTNITQTQTLEENFACHKI
ncbi:unnamed protein product [Dracunculus medinensis]|uniref:Uncharacterized protein n=1 Tax=Dracunculus medinensis TaxID=318479 RepID=A0A0N4UMQ1_DRAME|nr:unnamed protein product [Dracunculus medinensis]